MSRHLPARLLSPLCALLLLAGCAAGDDDDADATPTPLEPTPTPLEPTPTPTPGGCDAAREDAPCATTWEGPAITVVQDGRFEYLEAFPSALLGNTRDIRIYLPASYTSESSRRWPVLYMHDGQNLFDASSAAFGVEWEVDENVDALVATGELEELIVVGIDNTVDRIDEYTPTRDPAYGGGDGDTYARFVIEELKPYIDTHYRTICGSQATAVMGSSLGGLISCYMGLTWPEVFGHAGCVSPSFWWDDNSTLRSIQAETCAVPAARLWIDAGTAEGSDDDGDGLTYMVEDARAVRDALLDLAYTFEDDLGYQEQLLAAHNEAAWASRVANPLLFMFGIAHAPGLEQIDLVTYGDTVALSGVTVLNLEVNAFYDNGLEMTVPNPLTALESQDEAVAKVNAAGEVTPVAVGTAVLEALYRGRSDQASVKVVDDLSNTVSVTFDVTVPASTPAGATVYIVGNLAELGSWNPGLVAMTKQSDTRWTLTRTFTRGQAFEYKYTRGSWSSVEKDAAGGEISNRTGQADQDKTIEDTVEKWADQP